MVAADQSESAYLAFVSTAAVVCSFHRPCGTETKVSWRDERRPDDDDDNREK